MTKEGQWKSRLKKFSSSHNFIKMVMKGSFVIVTLLLLTSLTQAENLVVKGYGGFSQGYATSPSYDGQDTIYLLGGGGTDLGVFNQVWSYSLLSPPKFKVVTNFPFPVTQLVSSATDGAGNIFFFTTTYSSVTIFKFTVETQRVTFVYKFVDTLMIPSFSSVLFGSDFIFFLVSPFADAKSNGIMQFNLISNQTKRVEIPIGSNAPTAILASDGNKTFYAFGGRKNSRIVKLIYDPTTSKFRKDIMKETLPVDIISNTFLIGKSLVMFSTGFDLVAMDVESRVIHVEQLEIQLIEKKFQRFTGVYVEQKSSIYIFACGGRIRGCTVFTIHIGLTAAEKETLVALEGWTLTLICKINGSPTPVITWEKDGRIIKNGLNMDGNSSLTLNSVGFGDQGVYTCRGTNLYGVKIHQVHLIVKRGTTIEKWQDSITKKPGDKAKLWCKATLDNSPKISWYKGDSLINCPPDCRNPRFRKKGSNALEIVDLDESDSGNYSCVVDSSLGDTLTRTLTLLVTNETEVEGDENNVNFNVNSTIPEPVLSYSLMLTIVLIAISALGLCIMICIFGFWKYRKIRHHLSPTEIREFKHGSKSAENNYSLEEFTYGQPYDPSYELPLYSFQIQRESLLGQGEFGVVYKGVVTLENKSVDVAFKMTKMTVDDVEVRKKQLKSLLAELKVMIHIGSHPNIIKLVGAHTRQLKDGVVYVALEFCINGNLERFLRDSKHESKQSSQDSANEYAKGAPITTAMMCSWSLQISRGMEYLSSKKIIHSDLATRNILVAADLSIRITDFGLSRRLENYTNYVKMGGEPLPWRWMAVESLEFRNFSTQSDVWSFGITIWEIYSMGSIPYPGQCWTADFVQKLVKGERLPPPEHASPEIYKKLRECWLLESSQRPTFKELRQFFQACAYKIDNIVYLGPPE